MVMTQADRLKWIALALLVFQNGITPLILRFAMSEASSKDRFDTGQAVLVQEAMKVGLSIVLLLSESGSVPELAATLRKEVVEKPADTLKLAVPAVLYFIQNVMMQLGSANLPAAVFGVTYQGRTLVVAFTSVVLLSTRLTRAKWLSLAILGSGLAIVNLSNNKESGKSAMANADEQNVAKGLFFVITGCFCSAFAGVYFEKMMKHGAVKPSMWLRNVQLASFSVMIGFVQMIFRIVFYSDSKVFMHGFTPKVWVMVLNNAVGGLIVAGVIKYADNILKGFGAALATVWSAMASVPLFGFGLSPSFAIGTMMVLGATLIYGGTIKVPGEYWAGEPPLCANIRQSNQTSANAEKTGGAVELEKMPLLPSTSTEGSAVPTLESKGASTST